MREVKGIFMLSLNRLRITIGIFFLVFVCEELMFSLYDPGLSSSILLQARNLLDELIKSNLVYNVFGLLDIIAMSYSFAALWFGYNSGKWLFILFLIFELVIQCLTPVIAYSGKTGALDSLYFLILGIILAMLYQSPIKEMLLDKKPFKVWHVAGMFIIFLAICIIPAVVASSIGK